MAIPKRNPQLEIQPACETPACETTTTSIPTNWKLSSITISFTPASETSAHFWTVELCFPHTATGIKAPVYSPLELTTLLEAIGSGRMTPWTETTEDFLARGGQITHCPTKYAEGSVTNWRNRGNLGEKADREIVGKPRKTKPKVDLTNISIEELLAGL